MMSYNLRLALLSIRKNPIISALTAAAIATGVGACVTMLAIYHLASNDPIPTKSAELFHVQLDGRPIGEDYEPGEEPREQLSYPDATNLSQADGDLTSAAMYKAAYAVQVPDSEIAPSLELVRVTEGDFFDLFNVEFEFGSGWPAGIDDVPEQIAVLSPETNEQLFGGENSVGKTVTLDGHQFRVVGVTKPFNPSPKFYDMTNGAFNDPETIYIPYSLTVPLEINNEGNTRCSGGLIDGFEAFLASNCTWVTYWVHLPTAASVESYRDRLRAYSEQQKSLGIFERDPNVRLRSVSEWMVENEVVPDDVRVLIWLSFLFLGVCLLNTVGLILTKFQARAPQVALRRALGATKGNVLRQNLVEVAALGVAGGLGGLGLGWLGLKGLAQFFTDQPEQKLMQLDAPIVGVAFLIAVGAAIIAGLYPAWRAGRVAPASMLKTQ